MPCFKSIIFYQYSPNTKLFLKKKNGKFSSAGGSAPRPPNKPHQMRISGYIAYAPATLCTDYNHMGFRNFCFEQFFFMVQLQTL